MNKKMSLTELAKKAQQVASSDLLNTIAGGTKGQTNLNGCHGAGCHMSSVSAAGTRASL